MDLNQHNIEIQQNLEFWQRKPKLQDIYAGFYRLIASQLNRSVGGKIVELGSGIGNVKMMIPEALCTDLFPNPWIDQVENAYRLSFSDNSLSNLILFDVFHHLEFPGTALAEFSRVLQPSGRIIIFDPYISLTGMMVYGLFHHEPVAMNKKINWFAPEDFDPWKSNYYAAQGNATRIFFSGKYTNYLQGFDLVARKRIPALSYIASGGYSKPQLFPDTMFTLMEKTESLLKYFPLFFATRTLIVLSAIPDH
jgi:SAM-dependent methyltransferase